jgi:hypothetical protein
MTADPDADYKVGRGKPPLHTRFKKGNPGGRPRGARNLRILLEEALAKRVPVTTEGGRRRWIARREPEGAEKLTAAPWPWRRDQHRVGAVDRVGYAHRRLPLPLWGKRSDKSPALPFDQLHARALASARGRICPQSRPRRARSAGRAGASHEAFRAEPAAGDHSRVEAAAIAFTGSADRAAQDRTERDEALAIEALHLELLDRREIRGALPSTRSRTT